MTSTALAAFLLLAAECTPRTVDGRPIVAPETLASVVRTESGFASWAVGINEPGARAPAFASQAQAAAWVAANAHRSLDVGVTQINSSAGHMQRRGLPVAAALDPCVAIRVGSEVLRDCYRTAPARDEQARLREAASCYNTGTHTRGFGNGYVQRIQASAEVVVPAIRLRGEAIAPVAPVPAVPRPAVSLPLLNLLQPDVPSASPAAPALQQQDEVP